METAANCQRDARVQGSRPRLGRGRQECTYRAICFGMFHGKVRSDDRRLLSEGDRSGQLAVCTRDPRHRRHRTIREYARSIHKERPRIRRSLQSDESSDFPRYQSDEGIDNARQRYREGARIIGRQQARSRASTRSGYRRGQRSGATLGMSVRRGIRETPHERERRVRGNCT